MYCEVSWYIFALIGMFVFNQKCLVVLTFSMKNALTYVSGEDNCDTTKNNSSPL